MRSNTAPTINNATAPNATTILMAGMAGKVSNVGFVNLGVLD
jgi:hypothetical protein